MLLERLTSACGLPGFEDEVRDIIKAELEGFVDSFKVDRMGNLIVEKNGGLGSNSGLGSLDAPHIALSAHMDEVGLCVKHINKDGTIKFASWGVDERLLPSMHVLVGAGKIPGVIGTKPFHLQSAAEKRKVTSVDNLSIDIGCDKKEECERLVNLGDFVAFDSEYVEFGEKGEKGEKGESKIKAKALDDRVGCAAIIEILKMDLPCRLTGVFCTQEEVGLRGSAVAANGLDVSLVINIEGTVCADLEGIPVSEHVTTQGAGPALSLMDRSSIYLRKYIDEMAQLAEANGVPYQYRRTGMGGTDAGNFHTAKTGTPCLGIAVPCRYIHSPVSVMDRNDYENLIKLIELYIKSKGKGRGL